MQSDFMSAATRTTTSRIITGEGKGGGAKDQRSIIRGYEDVDPDTIAEFERVMQDAIDAANKPKKKK